MSLDKIANQGVSQGLAVNKVFNRNNDNLSVSNKSNNADNSISNLQDNSKTQKAYFEAKQGMLKDLFGVQEESNVKTSSETLENNKAKVGAANDKKAPEELTQTQRQEQTGITKSIGTENKGSKEVVDDNRLDKEKEPLVEAVKINNSLLQQQTQVNSVENSAHIG